MTSTPEQLRALSIRQPWAEEILAGEKAVEYRSQATTTRYLCEPKSKAEMKDEVVLAKARAAALWCKRATEHAGGKPWKYLLIPHDAIDEAKTLAGLAATYEFHG